MSFCSVELARAIERAECALLADACAVAARRLASVLARPISGGFAAFTEPGAPLDKIAGLGFADFDRAAFEELEELHRSLGAPVQVEIATLADSAIARWLTGRGYELVNVENVLGLELGPTHARPDPAGVSTRIASEAEFDTWFDVVVTGFAHPDTQGVASAESFDTEILRRTIGDFARAASLTWYLAELDGHAAGGAAMRARGELAQLCGAATLPASRRRGVQSALLRRRLSDAQRAGCRLAVMTTQPGSKSQENAARQGFTLLYARNVLRHEPH
jgi:GNAT superfamily N-acetyltransferase